MIRDIVLLFFYLKNSFVDLYIEKMSSKNALAAIQTMKIVYGSQGRQNILPYHYLG